MDITCDIYLFDKWIILTTQRFTIFHNIKHVLHNGCQNILNEVFYRINESMIKNS